MGATWLERMGGNGPSGPALGTQIQWEEVMGWIAFFVTPLMGQDLQLATRRRYMIGRLLRKHHQFQELTCRLWGAAMDPKVDGVADAPIRVGSTRGGRGGAR
ncbi:hypothetical protein CSW47_09620 [Thermus scotoductus]|uniref:Uncharacterized protein n=1 Tax=Thermus scotoductus TaxID=37636 RepID=A0A430R6G9_THESC|nr:hypothetical protein CSW47_09620 [Thermus scotoductus]